MSVRGLLKPEFIYRPSQIVKRLLRVKTNISPRSVMLPWNLPIRVDPQEHVGRAIFQNGIFDLGVTETLWRLSQPGTLMLDVGANIGYMTSVLAAGCNFKGEIISFEPMPSIFQDLQANCDNWKTDSLTLTVHQMAVSNTCGLVRLNLPIAFDRNRGIAFISSDRSNDAATERLDVKSVTIDEILGDRTVSVMKVDVEGHELSVFEGGLRAMQSDRIQHIVLEDNDKYPTSRTNFLIENGYTLFRICRPFGGPILLPPDEATVGPHWDSPAYLATLEPVEVKRIFSTRGWQCLTKRKQT